MKFMKFMIISATIFVSETPAFSSEVTLESFIQTYNSRNKQLFSSGIQSRNASIKAEIDANSGSDNLTLKPYAGKSTTEQGGTMTNQGFVGVEADYRHQLSIGTQAYLTGDYRKLQDAPSGSDSSQSLRIGAEHPLTYNAMGQLQDLSARSAVEAANYQKLVGAQTKIRSCVTASSLYIDAFFQLEKLDILQRQQKNSQKNLNRAKKDRQQRMIKKTDLLSAQTDLLNNNLRVAEASSRLESAILAMGIESNILQLKLSSPEITLENILKNIRKNVAKILPKSNLLTGRRNLDLLRSKINSASLEFKQAQEAEKNKVGIFADYTVSNSSTPVGEVKNNTYQIGIKAEHPFFGDRRSERVRISGNRMTDAKFALAQTEKDLSIEIKKLRRSLSRLDEINKINHELKSIVDAQIKEAEKNFRFQKTSFEAYRLTRDSLLSMQLGFISYRKQKLTQILQLFKTSGQFPKICEASR